MDRVALVTGGTRGIGAAISRMLKLRGYVVAANYAGNDVAASQFKEETGIPVYKFDVGDFAAVTAAVAQIEKDLGPIDVVVNNAGITRDATMRRLTRENWDQVMNTNLGSCFNVCKAVWDGMNTRGFGRIVNIGSINGQGGQYGQVNYAAASAGPGRRRQGHHGQRHRARLHRYRHGLGRAGQRARENCRKNPCRPSRQGRRDRPRRAVPGRRRRRLHHRLDAQHQRRPAYVLRHKLRRSERSEEPCGGANDLTASE